MPKELKIALNKAGFSWEEIYDSAEQIVIFGSRAAGFASENSDWDLFLVGEGKTTRTQYVDLVWVNKERFKSDNFMGDELISSVMAYGIWLKGENNLVVKEYPSSGALGRKYRKIKSKLNGLEKSWEVLLAPYRRKHLINIRRDMQRYLSMKNKEAVNVTPMYDSKWESVENKTKYFLMLIDECDLMSPFMQKILITEVNNI